MKRDSMEHDGSGEFLSLDGPETTEEPLEGLDDLAGDFGQVPAIISDSIKCIRKKELPEAESLLRKALSLDPLRKHPRATKRPEWASLCIMRELYGMHILEHSR